MSKPTLKNTKLKGRHITGSVPHLHFEIFFTRPMQFSLSWSVGKHTPKQTECLYPKGSKLLLLFHQKKYSFKKQAPYDRKLCGAMGNKSSSCRSDKCDWNGLKHVHGPPGEKTTQRSPQQQALWLQWMPNEFITIGHFKWNATPP